MLHSRNRRYTPRNRNQYGTIVLKVKTITAVKAWDFECVTYHNDVEQAFQAGIAKADRLFSYYPSVSSLVIAVEKESGALIRHQVITRSEWKQSNNL